MDFLGNCSELLPRFLGTSLVETRIGDLCRSIEGTRFLQLSLGILIPMFPMYLSISNKAGTGHRLLPLNNILHIQLKNPRNSLPTVHTLFGYVQVTPIASLNICTLHFLLAFCVWIIGSMFLCGYHLNWPSEATSEIPVPNLFTLPLCMVGDLQPPFNVCFIQTHNQFFFLANLWISLASPS